MLADIPEMNVYPESEVADYLAGVSTGRNAGVQMLVVAASHKNGVPTWLNNATAIITCGENAILAHRYYGAESALASALYSDKAFTKERWLTAGVRTPQGRLVSSDRDAIAFQKEIGKSIVLKPRFSFASKGVSVDLRTEGDIREGYVLARAHSPHVLAEEFIPIRAEYRCFVGADQVYALVERLPPHVVGDGTSTIAELIGARNRVRQTIPSTRNEPIQLQGRVKRYLQERNKSIETVLPDGDIQQLSHMRVLGEGGDLYGVLDAASDEIKALAVRAANVIPGAHWAGLDLIEGNDGKTYAIEINSNAQLNGIQYPTYGVAVPIAEKLLEERLKQTPRGSYLHESQKRLRSTLPEVNSVASHVFGTKQGEPDSLPLRVLFYRWLQQCGFELEWINSKVVEASKKEVTRWFKGCLSSKDLEVVVKVAEKHSVVRRALAKAAIPVTRGKWLGTRKELAEYLREARGPISVTPQSAPWKGSKEYIGKGDETEPIVTSRASRYGFYVQQVTSGARLRIIAGPDRAYVVLQDGEKTVVDVGESVNLAIRAVRSIPQLGWAAVDIVLTKRFGVLSTPLVEGLSLDPEISSRHRVTHGDLDEFYDYLLAQ